MEVMAYGECCVNEMMIREQRFVKICSKWFMTKKKMCHLSISTWRRTAYHWTNRAESTHTVHRLTAKRADDCKHQWHWREAGLHRKPQCCPSFLYVHTVQISQWHSDLLTEGVFALLFTCIGKSIKGLKSYSHFALWWVPNLLQRVEDTGRK